ncbi:MAG: alpha/beta hydrolase, partial [Muribaculaceae bacterium]|nr:alpha/beta hydrolase [Muribaculaceae bacterium]
MDKFLEIDGVRLHYADTGKSDGKPIIIMHGYGCNINTVASIAAILEPGMRVINIDLPGHGKSDEPPYIWGVNDYTVCIERLIEKLELKHVSLLGHSFGGRIGILLSSRNNDINKLVLVDAAGIKPKRSLKY